MNIVVFIKQVPADNNIPISTTNTLNRQGIPHIINPADLNALEASFCIKDHIGGNVTVCTMGPTSAEGVLKYAAAMGADRIFLISDLAFAGSDTYATAKVLSKAVHYLGGFDMLVCGRRSTDGETGQVGPELASILNIPCATNCVSLQVKNNSVLCRRLLEKEYQDWQLPLPSLVTVYTSINSPRLPSISGLRRAKDISAEILTATTLGLSPDECGLKGSPTNVHRIMVKPLGKRTAVRMAGTNGIQLALKYIADTPKEVNNA